MPVLPDCRYKAPFWLPGGHAQTMGPRISCFIPKLPFARESLELDDGDQILVDWLFASGRRDVPATKLAILSHGLEGDSTRSYMRAMAIALFARGWDVASRNFRGCGGEMNRLPQLYHSGDVYDLSALIRYAVVRGYGEIGLVGFSMGGNQVLKYLGECAEDIPVAVTRAGMVSVPCDLTGCSVKLAKPGNRIYMEYFMRTLRCKMRQKHAEFPALFDISRLDAMKTFKEFDDTFTAPLNGFADAEDYWAKASSLPFLGRIARPTLVINARNDPFLSETCYPVKEAQENETLFLCMPEQGGHVGFPTWAGKTVGGWLENTVAAFLDGVAA